MKPGGSKREIEEAQQRLLQEQREAAVKAADSLNAQKWKSPQPVNVSVTFRAVDTEVRKINDLDPFWLDPHTYTVLLPADLENLASRVVEFLSEDLERMLKMKYHVFWSNVLHHKTMMKSVDSMLRFFPRPHDIGATKHVVFQHPAALLLYRRLFLVMQRLSSPRESEQHFMDAAFWAQIVRQHQLLDIARILDIVALYGPTNMPQVVELLGRVFSLLPSLYDAWAQSADRLVAALDELLARAEHLAAAGGVRSQGESATQKHERELHERLLLAYDAAATTALFLRAHPPGTHALAHVNALRAWAGLYDGPLRSADQGDALACRARPAILNIVEAVLQHAFVEMFRSHSGGGPGPGRVSPARRTVSPGRAAADAVGRACVLCGRVDRGAAEETLLSALDALATDATGAPAGAPPPRESRIFRDLAQQRNLSQILLRVQRCGVRDPRLQFFISFVEKEFPPTASVSQQPSAAVGPSPRSAPSPVTPLPPPPGTTPAPGVAPTASFSWQPRSHAAPASPPRVARDASVAAAAAAAAAGGGGGIGGGEGREGGGERAHVESQREGEMEKVEAMQALFPDLGEGFILVVLRYYDMQLERAVDAVLSNTLPPGLMRVPRDLRRRDAGKYTLVARAPAAGETPLLDKRMDASAAPLDLRGIDRLPEAVLPPSKQPESIRKHLDRPSASKHIDFISEYLQRAYDAYEDEYDDALDDVVRYDVLEGADVERARGPSPKDARTGSAAGSDAAAAAAAAASGAPAGGGGRDGRAGRTSDAKPAGPGGRQGARPGAAVPARVAAAAAAADGDDDEEDADSAGGAGGGGDAGAAGPAPAPPGPGQRIMEPSRIRQGRGPAAPDQYRRKDRQKGSWGNHGRKEGATRKLAKAHAIPQ